MQKNIAVIPGDGIGEEVMAEALKILAKISDKFQHNFVTTHGYIGGAAYDKFKDHFPEKTREICEKSDAILFGSVGGPVTELNQKKWQNCEINSVLGLRKYFNFNINLRPSKVYSSLENLCVLRSEIIEKGVDIMCVRELSSGIYFGKKWTETVDGKLIANDTMTYDETTIANIAKAAFRIAMKRKKKVTSVDKANVLDCGKLWRRVVTEISREFPEVQLEHMLVDNCAMQILKRPSDFDVMLMSNMFGDILSDELSVLAGSLGMLPSASINSDGFAMYEPSGGSAPDIANKGIANPIAQILCVAMMLKYSFNLQEEHDVIVNAVEKALEKGARTGDIAEAGNRILTTAEMGDAICNGI